jgi:hypothetical protein
MVALREVVDQPQVCEVEAMAQEQAQVAGEGG